MDLRCVLRIIVCTLSLVLVLAGGVVGGAGCYQRARALVADLSSARLYRRVVKRQDKVIARYKRRVRRLKRHNAELARDLEQAKRSRVPLLARIHK